MKYILCCIEDVVNKIINNMKEYITLPEYEIIAYEDGQEVKNIPLYTTKHNDNNKILNASSNNNNNNNMQPIKKIDIDTIPGAFILQNVFTSDECERMIKMAEIMKFTPDTPVSLSRKVRQNDAVVWLMRKGWTNEVTRRCLPHLPQKLNNIPTLKDKIGNLVGINARCRFYRYNSINNDKFLPHHDGAWPEYKINNDTNQLEYPKLPTDVKALSFYTFLIYLNNNYINGGTNFLIPRDETAKAKLKAGKALYSDLYTTSVKPTTGSVLVFPHGVHPLSYLHEGLTLENGIKYVARTDVLYEVVQNAAASSSKL